MSVSTARKHSGNRTPPKRRRPRKSAWKRVVWPLLKATVVLGLVGFVIVVVGAKIVRPFKLINVEGREEQRIARELADLKAENAALERQIRHLNTPKGISQAARKLGYVKPGEITLVIPEEGKATR